MRTTSRILGAALAFALAAAAPAGADGGAGRLASDLRVHGTLDLNLHAGYDALDLNGLGVGDSPFDPYRMRLFLESQVAPGIQVYAQSLLDESHVELVEGAYAMISPWRDRDLHLLAGKIPSPIGTWEPRGYSDRNPLIGRPLVYSYYTSLQGGGAPATADALLKAAGTGAEGPDYGYGSHGPGLTIVWDGWWDAGITAEGSLRPFEFAFAATQGTPSSPAPGDDWNVGNSWMGRIGLAPTPGLRFGVSGSTGPYLPEAVADHLAPGLDPKSYRQDLAMADAEWEGGRLELHAEGAVNDWGTPTLGKLWVRGGYVEARLGLGAAWWVAGRGESLRFSHILGSAGESPWDDDIDRYEAGLGYRLDRDARVKLAVQRNRRYEGGVPDVDDLIALQLSLGF